MEKSEATIQREIVKYLEKENWYVIKLIQTNKNGIPDLMAIKEGKSIFIEVKRANKKPRALQAYRMKELKAYGVKSFVAHSVDEIKQ